MGQVVQNNVKYNKIVLLLTSLPKLFMILKLGSTKQEFWL